MNDHKLMLFETRFSLTEAKNPKSNPGMIEAQMTTFGKREGADGRKFWYKPEGFAEFIKAFQEGDKPLPMYYNHDSYGMPIGEWNRLEMDENGINGYGRLYMNTTNGNNVYNIMKESPMMINSVSVGAYADEIAMLDEDGNEVDEYDEGCYMNIKKGGLQEVSIVMYPNNELAKISSLEHCLREDKSISLKEVERLLRDAGLSRANATAAASVLNRLIELRDAAIKSSEHNNGTRDESAAVEDDLNRLAEEMLLMTLHKQLAR